MMTAGSWEWREQAEVARRSIAPLLDRGPFALVDFPNHGNVGDSAIWCGERTLLKALGSEVVFASHVASHHDDELRRRLGAGTILLHGGGNFGDLWPSHHRFRLHILETFPQNPVVQLPQSIWFDDMDAATSTREALARHPDFHLLVRDHRSLEYARDVLGEERTSMAPDSAVHLPGVNELPLPHHDVVFLARKDKEATGFEITERDGVVVRDWRDVQPAGWTRLGDRLAMTVAWRLAHIPRGPQRGVFPSVRLACLDALARRRLDRGLELLASGGTVITDRLHGHLLSLLLGKRHVLLPDRRGKVRAYWDTWTKRTGTPFASTVDEAMRLAREMASR